MKTWAGRRSVDGEKLSRRLELVSKFPSNTKKSPRRFRIGLADDLFANPRCGMTKPEIPNAEPESPKPIQKIEREVLTESSRTDLVIGLAAIAGLTLGYLIGRRRK